MATLITEISSVTSTSSTLGGHVSVSTSINLYPERSALGRHYGVVFYVDYHDLKIAMTAQFVNGKPIFTEFEIGRAHV